MSPTAAATNGLKTVFASPRLVLGLWALSLVFALPFAWLIGQSIHDSIGGSLVDQKLRDGFDMGWFGEYEAKARGIETSFTPTISGVGAVLDNLEAALTGRLFAEQPALVGAGLLYALLWAFLMGGVLDRYARPTESVVRARFAQAGGLYFFRFLRLAVISAVPYYLIYRLHRWMFHLLESATRDVTREWIVLWASLLVYAITALLLTVVNMGFGYAKIATVVENRSGMLRAALRGLGFVVAFPAKTFGLYYGLIGVWVALLAVWAAVAPGAGQAGPLGVGLAFVAAQIFLVARLVVRLTLYGGQTALYRSHAPR